MLEESLSYPQRNGGWRTILIGGLLMLFGFLVVPIFVVYGYTVRVLRSAALGEEMAPRFEDWGGLLVDGLKAFVIGVAYVVVPYVVVFIALFGGLLAASGENEAGAAVAIVLLLLGLVAFVALFVVAYVLPVALTNFALEDRLGAAFEFRNIATAAFTRDYLVAVLLSMGVGVVVGFVFFFIGFVLQIIIFAISAAIFGGGGDPGMALGAVSIVSVILFLGFFFVVVFVGFYVQVVTYYLLGRGSGVALVDESAAVDRPTD